MADNNNFSRPFGRATGDAPNRPLDITSDMWTPISTGAPLPGASRLQDAQSTAQQTPQTVPQKDGSKQKPDSKKRPKKKKAAAKKLQREKSQKTPKDKEQAKPVRKAALVASRAEELRRQSAQNKERRTALQQKKRAQRSQEEFERRRQSGDSGDEIRRVKAQRKRRRKRLTAILTVAVVLVIAGLAALVYALSYGAPIAKIVATGSSVYSEEEIVNASGVMVGENMFRVRSGAMNKRLCALLPYIGSVHVDYQLPDVLALEITDTTDKYLISGKSAFLCVDDAHKILSQKKKKVQDGQFRLDGFEAAEGEIGTEYRPQGDDKARFDAAQEIVDVLLQNGLQKANILNLSDLSDIIIRYDGRINIYLGTTKNLSVRLRAAAETLLNHLSDNTIGYLEITHAGKIFLYEGSMTKD